jgi:hypothetical protein
MGAPSILAYRMSVIFSFDSAKVVYALLLILIISLSYFAFLQRKLNQFNAVYVFPQRNSNTGIPGCQMKFLAFGDFSFNREPLKYWGKRSAADSRL